MVFIKKGFLVVKIFLILTLYIFLRSEYHLIPLLLAELSIKANPNTGYLYYSPTSYYLNLNLKYIIHRILNIVFYFTKYL
jgi:hypothetical protein